LIDFLIRGGPIMAPIGLCSVVALALFLQRVTSLRISKVAPRQVCIELLELARQARWADALTLCKKHELPICRVLEVAFERVGANRRELKEATLEVGRREVMGLERYAEAIGVIAAVTPLLGLLGTVLGMIQTFDVIQVQGMGEISGLAGGISQALITTFTGLSVGIPALIGHRYLLAKVDGLSLAMEQMTSEVLDILSGATK
jgi:biopolymer transport protein ExbB